MLFNSYSFILLFLPVTLIIYFGLAKFKYIKLATTFLVCASLAFYSFWDIRYLPLLLGSMLFNYLIGVSAGKKKSKILLIIGIAIDLGLLGYFKYTGFFVQSINSILNTVYFVPQIILPLGISFFTFTQIAYLVDAYRGETKQYSFLHYSLFVTLFPHLIAGPILYHKDMIPQFSKLRNFIFSPQNLAIGLTIFVIGLVKKVCIADDLAPAVKAVFDNITNVTILEAWGGALGYTFQLYFDFSGYSDMAIGIGLMFNLRLPLNFNSPYKSTSIIEFWRRWHITLSSFLKNYLYIPLGGNRYGEFNRFRNLIITMLLGGLWHGAGWTYVVWGGLHGAYLAVNHAWRKLNIPLPTPLAWLLTFLCVVVAWVFFRADSLQDATALLAIMFGFKGVAIPDYIAKYSVFHGLSITNSVYLSRNKISTILELLVLILILPETHRLSLKIKPTMVWGLIIGIAFAISILSLNNQTEFLYFQF